MTNCLFNKETANKGYIEKVTVCGGGKPPCRLSYIVVSSRTDLSVYRFPFSRLLLFALP